MKMRSLIICLLATIIGYSQTVLKITQSGEQLKEVYLAMDVEHFWIAKHHINWETGRPDEPDAKQGTRTHCSAFVAAACEKLNIYMLRPPQHGQVLLANAQSDWLNSDEAQKEGWQQLTDDDSLYIKAQKLANEGKVVVAICRNPVHSKPGHVGLVMPFECSAEQLKQNGPEIIMAGTQNYNYIPLIAAFKSHITSWPSHEIQFFVYNTAPE